MNEDVATPRVLVVDDDPPIRSLIAKVLDRQGIDVSTASDGQEAIELLQKGNFEAIVLDLMMPVKNGYDVLDFIDALPDRRFGVVVVTAGADRELNQLKSPSVHSVIRKPFDIALLGDIVGTVARDMAALKRGDSAGDINVVNFCERAR